MVKKILAVGCTLKYLSTGTINFNTSFLNNMNSCMNGFIKSGILKKEHEFIIHTSINDVFNKVIKKVYAIFFAYDGLVDPMYILGCVFYTCVLADTESPKFRTITKKIIDSHLLFHEHSL